mgnify:CR=1 FL=1
MDGSVSESADVSAEYADQFTQVVEHMISAEFRIDLPYSIKSNNQVQYTRGKDVGHSILWLVYPENEILILNRWNQIVYKTTNYGVNNNIFKGKHQKTGHLLPKGTYFYRFSYLNSNKVQKNMSGYIFINL